MLRRREKEEKTVRAGKRKDDAPRTPEQTEELESMASDAIVETDQISMSASRMNASLNKVRTYAKGTREERDRQCRQSERAREELAALRQEVERLQGAWERETACRQELQRQVLELMEHSKHYTGLIKALQKDQPDSEAEAKERREKLQQLVQLLKENNKKLGNIAKALGQQEKLQQREPAFLWEEKAVMLDQFLEEAAGGSQADLARQEALLGELETVDTCFAQQQESTEHLEKILEDMKGVI